MTSNRQPILATDLDGTFIPLGNDRQQVRDLRTLADYSAAGKLTIVFVTGRHLDSISDAVIEHDLPIPDIIIGDVGTSIYLREGDPAGSGISTSDSIRLAETHRLNPEYAKALEQIVGSCTHESLRNELQAVEGIRIQEPFKQGPFKLSYYAGAELLETVQHAIGSILADRKLPWELLVSVDPFNGDGLVDLLPINVNKSFALKWWLAQLPSDRSNVVFTGDSGNDLAALTSGVQAIVVGNASGQVVENVLQHHNECGTRDRVFLAKDFATSAVLAGCRWFGLLPPEKATAGGDARSGQLPLGATPLIHNKTRFSVQATQRRSMEVVVRNDGGERTIPMQAIGKNIWSVDVDNTRPGDRYAFVIDGQSSDPRPDPRSRCQPDGVHEFSQIVSHQRYPWQDQGWKGLPCEDLIVYELHIGTFNKPGTFLSAIERIPELVNLGITAVELLPVAQSAGARNWGYDGVNLFAPFSPYGTPDDLRRLVDALHAAGIAVILDVVYNHPGPEGNYLAEFGSYFSRKHGTPWGPAYNFDGRHQELARRYVVDNALYWLEEFHFDGLRFDAIHFMFDDSKHPIVAEVTDAVGELETKLGRKLLLIGETNVFDSKMIAPRAAGGYGFDAIWCDDFMHSTYSIGSPETRLTDRTYDGSGDLAETLRCGYLYEGFPRQRIRRKADQRPNLDHVPKLVFALQTHDGVGNHPRGQRLHHLAGANFQKACVALNLLYPAIPMIFMGDEFQESNPFHFFADFQAPWVRDAIEKGRRNEYPNHDWSDAVSPLSVKAFNQSRLSRPDSDESRSMSAWYRELIAIRKRWQTAGLLHHRNLTTFHDSEHSVFALTYENGSRSATVAARIVNPDQAVEDLVDVDAIGELRLHSAGSSEKALGPNQALVLES